MTRFPTNRDDYKAVDINGIFVDEDKPVGMCDLCWQEKWIKIKTIANRDYLVCIRCSGLR